MSSLSFKTTDAYDGTIVFSAPSVSGNYSDLILPLVSSDTSGNLLPGKSGVSIGTSSKKWSKAFIETLTANTTTSSSDLRLKENVESVPKDDVSKAKKAIKSLGLKSFTFKGEPNSRHLGLIAQDVEKALKNVGIDGRDLGIISEDENGYLQLDYRAVILLMLF